MHQRTDIASTLAVEQNREEALDERLEWEEKHMGGFRRMYPHKSRANYREQCVSECKQQRRRPLFVIFEIL